MRQGIKGEQQRPVNTNYPEKKGEKQADENVAAAVTHSDLQLLQHPNHTYYMHAIGGWRSQQ